MTGEMEGAKGSGTATTTGRARVSGRPTAMVR